MDENTELPGRQMERLIRDPTSLLRKLRRAPVTLEGAHFHALYFSYNVYVRCDCSRRRAEGVEAVFNEPALIGLPNEVQTTITRTMRLTEAFELPHRAH